MEYLYFVPKWFILYGLTLEFVFSMITFFVSIYAFKIYQIGKNKDIKILGTGFFLISLSYITWFILNLSSLIELNENTKVLEIKDVASMINLGAFMHIFFFIIGLITIIYATSKSKEYGTYLLLGILSIGSIILSNNKGVLFYMISAAFLLYLAIYYLKEYRIKENKRLLLMFSSFMLLFIGSIELIRSKLNIMNYVIGHLLILIAYIIILVNLITLSKNGKKKK